MAVSRSIISSGADLQKFRGLAHAGILRGEIGAGALARERLDAAHAGGNRAFADDLEQADIAGAAHMSAAAQLDRIGMLGLGARLALAHADDADLFAVFLAEQRKRALGDRLVGTHQMRLHRGVLQYHGVGKVLHRADLSRRHRPRMGEVEAEPPGLDQRALLRNVQPKHLAQRLVQEMRGGMIGARRGAAGMIDFEVDNLADFQRAGFDGAHMQEQAVQLLLGVLDGEARA